MRKIIYKPGIELYESKTSNGYKQWYFGGEVRFKGYKGKYQECYLRWDNKGIKYKI